MAYPGERPVRRLYDTAKRVRDELGKGQEALRVETGERKQEATNTRRAVVMVPDVDIKIVDVVVCGEGAAANDYAELLAPAAFDTAAGAANRLITQVSNANMADDTVFHATLANLNDNIVAAGQPIVLATNDNDSGGELYVFVQISYVLADDERTYRSYD